MSSPPPGLRHEKRHRWFSRGGTGWIRINPAGTADWSRDLDALDALPGLSGVMLAKCESAEQVAQTTARLPLFRRGASAVLRPPRFAGIGIAPGGCCEAFGRRQVTDFGDSETDSHRGPSAFGDEPPDGIAHASRLRLDFNVVLDVEILHGFGLESFGSPCFDLHARSWFLSTVDEHPLCATRGVDEEQLGCVVADIVEPVSHSTRNVDEVTGLCHKGSLALEELEFTTEHVEGFLLRGVNVRNRSSARGHCSLHDSDRSVCVRSGQLDAVGVASEPALQACVGGHVNAATTGVVSGVVGVWPGKAHVAPVAQGGLAFR